MTYAFIRDFEERKRQVRHYLAVVGREERTAGIPLSRVQEGRLLTLRAGTFLVLYNLVEASMRGAIKAIHDKITTSEAPFDLLVLCLRKEVIRLFKNDADPSKNHTLIDFPSAFVAIALAEGLKLSGNVDAKAIRELSVRYGFANITNAQFTRNGSDLLTIKSNRNDLAHGRKTFEEIGRDYARTELLLLARRSMRYVDEILRNVVIYLDRQLFLEFPPRALDLRPLSALNAST